MENENLHVKNEVLHVENEKWIAAQQTVTHFLDSCIQFLKIVVKCRFNDIVR